MTIIDAHAHLWKKQDGVVNGMPVRGLRGGRSEFCGEIRQMTPPYMTDGENVAEVFLSNMDYARVAGAVITQEEMDGRQDGYLLTVKEKYPDRFKICSLYKENEPFTLEGFDGVKLCACRLPTQDLTKHFAVFEAAAKAGKFVSLDLSDGDAQTGSLREIVQQLPALRVAIGHFGMVTRPNWTEQIKLARYPNVRVESGGITWLFNGEFYPYPSAVRAIKEAAELAGMDKLMWGSDYPRTMVEITYKMSYDFIVKSNELTDAEKALLLGENAAAFYGFADPVTPPLVKHML
ncbi:MAG: amidohydrolase [Clostridia bacterium]|nr:amidohydrolase [Clostridia bacterium]